jgi:hypothetical protein
MLLLLVICPPWGLTSEGHGHKFILSICPQLCLTSEGQKFYIGCYGVIVITMGMYGV